MNVAVATTIGAFLGGLLVYGFFSWVLWDVDITSLAGIVGLAAIAGGGIGALIARRRAAARPAPRGKR